MFAIYDEVKFEENIDSYRHWAESAELGHFNFWAETGQTEPISKITNEQKD